MIEPRQQSAVFGTLARELIAHGKGFRFCARGRSMWPTIQDGDILHVEPFTKSPKRGDIVLFFREGKFGAHRIIGGADNNYVTRGDAGMEIDGVVRREEMIGKVVAK
ncbi:MAG TPA: S26 family signal peptidase, partial [Terriglobales bacterium]|nr:S26 family signal peptidase [Terriglobales bacterium]